MAQRTDAAAVFDIFFPAKVYSYVYNNCTKRVRQLYGSDTYRIYTCIYIYAPIWSGTHNLYRYIYIYFTYIQACIHAYMRKYIHEGMRTYMHTNMHANSFLRLLYKLPLYKAPIQGSSIRQRRCVRAVCRMAVGLIGNGTAEQFGRSMCCKKCI